MECRVSYDNEVDLSYADVEEILERNFKLDYHPVAVKFFTSETEAAKYKSEKRFRAKATFCQFAAAARFSGTIMKGSADRLLCENAKTTFGFTTPSLNEAKGHMKYVLDLAFCHDVLKSKPRLEPGSITHFLTAPLGRTPVDPDVVMFVCNPFQAYHILNDYIGKYKVHPLQFNHTVNSAVCGGAVWTKKQGKPNMTTMCAGSYTSGKTEKGEVNLFIPGHRIKGVAEQTLKRVQQYNGSSLLTSNNEWPGMDACKKCPLLMMKEEE